MALPPRLALIGFNYSQPFLITRIINYVGQPEAGTSANDGYGLIGATAIIYTGIGVRINFLRQAFRRQTLNAGIDLDCYL